MSILLWLTDAQLASALLSPAAAVNVRSDAVTGVAGLGPSLSPCGRRHAARTGEPGLHEAVE